jgi:hypothetical protein
MIRWAGQVACTVNKINTYNISAGKPKETRSLGGPTRRSTDGIKKDLRKVV